MSDRDEPKVEQEREVVASRVVVRVVAGTLAIIIVAIGTSATFLGHDLQRLRGGVPVPTSDSRPAPRVIGVIEQTLVDDTAPGLAQKERDARELHRYAWVDRARGIGRIPIERAMALYAARHGGGLSALDAGAAP
jgi:hypothetical protein